MPSKSNVQDLTASTAPNKKKPKKDKSKVFTTSESELDVPVRRVSSENLAKLPTITPNEFTFFKLVEDGDLNGLKDFLSSKAFKGININKTDIYGFSALHHAVNRQDEEMVSLFLLQPGIITYDTLLYAIQEENIRITELILKYEDTHNLRPILPSGSVQHALLSAAASTTLSVGAPKVTTSILPPPKMETQKILQDLEDFDSEFPSYFTPFLKAAQMGNPELMELFWNRNERLETDEEHHNSGCVCRICRGGEAHIVESYERLHLFDALTNPTYICFLSSKQKVHFDPVNYALKKIIKCRELKTQTEVFRDKYMEYSERLQEFIKDFLSLCKTNEESELFMSIPLDPSGQDAVKKRYKRLEVLVGLNLVPIVAHPHSQYVVYKQWAASHWPKWQTYSNPYKLFHLVARILLFPFISLILWTGNRSAFCRQMGCPVSKCLNWLASYFFFLGVLFAQGYLPQRCNDGFQGKIPYQTEDGKCNERGAPNIGTEWVLVVYALGFFVSMIKKHSIPWIWDSYWTWYELIQQLLLIGTFICWAVAWGGQYPNEPRKAWDQYYPEILAELFLSLAIVFSFGRSFRLIQLNRIIGPLQIGLGRMITRLAPGVTVYLVMIGSYGTGLHAIYIPYHGIKGFDSSKKEKQQASPFGQILSSFEELFWGTFGMSGSDKGNIVNLGVKVNTTVEHLRHHWVNESTGKLLFGSFHILGIMMMFNMMVAYFTCDFDGVLENADIEWKFARTQIYMTYAKDSMLPPPFNIIPTVRGVLRFFEFCTHLFFGEASARKASCSFRSCCFISEPSDRDGDRRRLRAYRRLVLELTNRYHRSLEGKDAENPAVNDDVLEIGEEVAELKSVVEAKLRDLEGPPESSATPVTPVSSSVKPKPSHPYEELDSSDNESKTDWSRTRRLLFHKGSKGLLSKLHVLNPKQKGTTKQVDAKNKPIPSSTPESTQKIFGQNLSSMSSVTQDAVQKSLIATPRVMATKSQPSGLNQTLVEGISKAPLNPVSPKVTPIQPKQPFNLKSTVPQPPPIPSNPSTSAGKPVPSIVTNLDLSKSNAQSPATALRSVSPSKSTPTSAWAAKSALPSVKVGPTPPPAPPPPSSLGKQLTPAVTGPSVTSPSVGFKTSGASAAAFSSVKTTQPTPPPLPNPIQPTAPLPASTKPSETKKSKPTK